jgi:hypothetical protein
MHQTKRTYQDVETGRKFNLWMDNADNYHLIAGPPERPEDCNEGTAVNGFYISAHTRQTIKLNGKKLITLEMGQFYNLKAGEVITHKKYTGFSKFTKI